MADKNIIAVVYSAMDGYMSEIDSIEEEIDTLISDYAEIKKVFDINDTLGVYMGKGKDETESYNVRMIEMLEKVKDYINMCGSYIELCKYTTEEEDGNLVKILNSTTDVELD